MRSIRQPEPLSAGATGGGDTGIEDRLAGHRRAFRLLGQRLVKSNTIDIRP